MSDRTKAMDNLIAQDADLIDDRDVLTPVYLTGFENGRESERAKIVAWLRETQEVFQKLMDLGKHPLVNKHHMEHCKYSAEAIEAKEQLK
jgi:hypothetical protein